MFSVEYDSRAGIVRCESNGFFTVDDVRSHAKLTHDAIQQCQRDFGRVGVLVLSYQSAVQTPEVMEAARNAQWRVSGRDRMAIVLPSALARMQAARTFLSEREQAFLTEDEALAWLTAELEGDAPAIN